MRREIGQAFDGGADGHEFQQIAHVVDVGFDADDIIRTDGGGFLADQADGVLAGIIDQAGQLVDFAT